MERPLLVGILAVALAPSVADSGAWTQPEDSVLVIATTSRKLAPVGAFFGEPADSDKNTSQLFLEYGFSPDLTIGASFYGEFSTTSDDLEVRIGGHVRHTFWTGDRGDIMSVQAGISFPIERWLGDGRGDDRPQSASEADFRVLYGRGWQSDWGDSFLSGELGFRIRGETLDEEVRADLTLGHSPTDGLLGLFSVFTTVPLGDGSDHSLKLAPSIAYTFLPFLGDNDKKPEGPLNLKTLQLGIVWDALAPDDGLTLQLAIWKRF